MVLYQIGDRISQGASGELFVGECEGSPASIKVIQTTDPARVLREAQVLAKIPSHDNIVRFRAVTQERSEVHVVREWVDGITLDELVERSGRLSLSEVIHIVRSLLLGLGEAVHPAGVVHRDLSPANILIAVDGTVRITDFGISSEPSTSSDSDTFFCGTLPYTSPEQATGKGCDTRSDLFAVGVVLYELLTGRPPFIGPHRTMLHLITLPSPVSPPQTIEPMLPPALDNVTCRLLAKEPADRYQSARDALDDLNSADYGQIELAVRMRELSAGELERRQAPYLRNASSPPVQRARRQRSPWRSTLVAGLIGAGATTAGFMFWLSLPQPMQMTLPAPSALTAPKTEKRIPHESPRVKPPPRPRRSVRANPARATNQMQPRALRVRSEPSPGIMQPRARRAHRIQPEDLR